MRVESTLVRHFGETKVHKPGTPKKGRASLLGIPACRKKRVSTKRKEGTIKRNIHQSLKFEPFLNYTTAISFRINTRTLSWKENICMLYGCMAITLINCDYFIITFDGKKLRQNVA